MTNNVEASYLLETNDDRPAMFIMKMSYADRIPAISELQFLMGATVEVRASMTFEDLRREITAAQG